MHSLQCRIMAFRAVSLTILVSPLPFALILWRTAMTVFLSLLLKNELKWTIGLTDTVLPFEKLVEPYSGFDFPEAGDMDRKKAFSIWALQETLKNVIGM